MANKLKALEKARDEAKVAWAGLIDERNGRLDEAVCAYRDKIDAELGKEYDERTKALAIAYHTANEAFIVERDRVAVEEPDTPLPVGTKVYEWQTQFSSWHEMKPSEYRLTGRVGVIEVVTSQTVFPANLRYSKPSVGSWIIRLLDKSGNPTKKFVTGIGGWHGRSLPRDWCPEGKRPK